MAFNLDCTFTLESSLFDAIKLTKNSDLDKYSYPEYGIGLDVQRLFSLSDVSKIIKM